jgi:hypothetical protein
VQTAKKEDIRRKKYGRKTVQMHRHLNGEKIALLLESKRQA